MDDKVGIMIHITVYTEPRTTRISMPEQNVVQIGDSIYNLIFEPVNRLLFRIKSFSQSDRLNFYSYPFGQTIGCLTFYLTGIEPLFELFLLINGQQRFYFLSNRISCLPIVRVQIFELFRIYTLNSLFYIMCDLRFGDFIEPNILCKRFSQLSLFTFRR